MRMARTFYNVLSPTVIISIQKNNVRPIKFWGLEVSADHVCYKDFISYSRVKTGKTIPEFIHIYV